MVSNFLSADSGREPGIVSDPTVQEWPPGIVFAKKRTEAHPVRGAGFRRRIVEPVQDGVVDSLDKVFVVGPFDFGLANCEMS